MPAVHHLALRTRDLDALASFYVDVAGLVLVRDQRPRAIWLALGEAAVLMLETAGPAEPTIAPGSLELIAFAVDEGGHRRLRERLCALDTLEAETEHTLYTRDPDGRRVGFSTYPLGPESVTGEAGSRDPEAR